MADYKKFWTEFTKVAYNNDEFREVFRLRKTPSSDSTFYFTINGVYSTDLRAVVKCSNQFCKISAGILIEDNPNFVSYLESKKCEIESKVKAHLNWYTGNYYSETVLLENDNNDIENESNWSVAIDWLIKAVLLMTDVIVKEFNKYKGGK